MKRRILLALAVGLLLGADDAKKKDSASADLLAVQGAWVGVSAEAEGTKLPEEQAKRFKMVVKEKKMTFPGNHAATFELDPSKTPKLITITPLDGPKKFKPQRAIYAVEKDTLKLVLTNNPSIDDPQPAKEFATKAGEEFMFFTLKRESAAAKEGK